MSLSEYAIVTLAEAKNFLRIDDSDDDDSLELMLESATEKTEDYCSSYWVKRSVTETHIGDGKTILCLYRMPVESIESVTVDDVELEVTDYVELLAIGRLTGRTWTKDSIIEISYTAGYADSYGEVAVPNAAKLAVLNTIAVWWNNRTGVSAESVSGIGSVTYGNESELPDSVKAKLSSLRKRVL
jgi:uncharacterized phiE125 gp8 family phage protein